MKPHKHAELIKAWADGAEIEMLIESEGWVPCDPTWSVHLKYRIKPKSDIVLNVDISLNMGNGGVSCTQLPYPSKGLLQLTFHGETGKLKDAEVLK